MPELWTLGHFAPHDKKEHIDWSCDGSTLCFGVCRPWIDSSHRFLVSASSVFVALLSFDFAARFAVASLELVYGEFGYGFQ